MYHGYENVPRISRYVKEHIWRNVVTGVGIWSAIHSGCNIYFSSPLRLKWYRAALEYNDSKLFIHKS